MVNALWITLIGMGLVFIAILLLWGGMALLVKLTAGHENSEKDMAADAIVDADAEAASAAAALTVALAASGQEEARTTGSTSAYLSARKLRAAAAGAAVCLALALRKPARRENGAHPGALSAWQAVNRASQVNPAATLSRRKVAR